MQYNISGTAIDALDHASIGAKQDGQKRDVGMGAESTQRPGATLGVQSRNLTQLQSFPVRVPSGTGRVPICKAVVQPMVLNTRKVLAYARCLKGQLEDQSVSQAHESYDGRHPSGPLRHLVCTLYVTPPCPCRN
mmetsp:Transcript_7736/g.48008  ORF Transcript_7736/g.48008 Transcript_7736/m.48008 type:complete len:134 (-) Transcript_7736:938-1339(-)